MSTPQMMLQCDRNKFKNVVVRINHNKTCHEIEHSIIVMMIITRTEAGAHLCILVQH